MIKKQKTENLIVVNADRIQAMLEENNMLRKEIRVSRDAAEITASLVVRQFEETEKILHRLQIVNTQRKAVLDSASQISIIATDISGIITVFNKGAEKMLGYLAEDVIGKHTPEIFHLRSELNEEGERLSSAYNRKIEGFDIFLEYAIQNRSELQEWTYIRKNGTRFPVNLSVSPMRNTDNIIIGLLGIAADISEKKRSDRIIQESERKYRLLVKNLPNIVYQGNADGVITFFGDKIESLTGYAKEEFLYGRIKLSDLIIEEGSENIENKLKEAFETDKSYISEYRIRAKNGDIVWVEDRGQIVCDENGEIEFITGSLLDITERKLAEKALKESEEKYRSLFIGGPNPSFVIDRKTLEIFDANPMAEEIYGYAREELIGKSCTSLCSLKKDENYSPLCKKKIITTGCMESQKARHYKKNKKPFYVKVKTCPTIYKEKEAMILAVTDITELMEKEAQLIQANKMSALGQMSAGIAHELNQPLAAIRLGSEFLKMMTETGKAIPEQDLLQVVREINDQIDRSSDIINRLRTFGRRPDYDQEVRGININDSIRRVVEIIGQQLKLQNIKTVVELENFLPPVLARENLLEQVLFNLITNARDAVCQKQADNKICKGNENIIIIRSFRKCDRVGVIVSDTGTGISENIRDKIFEPFFTTKEVGKGMGLGLSILYGIVKDFEGDIQVQSEEGKGASFTITFPAYLVRIPI